MRDYTRFDKYLDELQDDIYPQPADPVHTKWAENAIVWLHEHNLDVKSVFDVGCGVGFCFPIFHKFGYSYAGITASEKDRKDAVGVHGANVVLGDMTYLPVDDNSYDLMFARHILEHSPFPIITLMEWRRVARYLCLIMPSPEYWGYAGKNHYSVGNPDQIWWWLRRAGWGIIDKRNFTTESSLFVEGYSDNAKRREKGLPLIEHPGPPKIVEYRYVCIRQEPIKE
jgi:SAM-dependent methyltransferase